MNILETIVARKKKDLTSRKSVIPVGDLEKGRYFKRTPLSLTQSLQGDGKTGIIAEFKRKSPSKGTINDEADVSQVTRAYTSCGASGLSVLTDEPFFGGRSEDLETARFNNIPILCKDFIIDSYQITEAKAFGADVILLIAACLTPGQVREMAVFAKKLQLEILLEIHNEMELGHICDEVDLVGVNNRDLKTFLVDIDHSAQLSKKIPSGKILVSESGISSVDTIRRLKTFGFKGFLMGETFMKDPDPAIAFASFVHLLKKDVP